MAEGSLGLFKNLFCVLVFGLLKSRHLLRVVVYEVTYPQQMTHLKKELRALRVNISIPHIGKNS